MIPEPRPAPDDDMERLRLENTDLRHDFEAMRIARDSALKDKEVLEKRLANIEWFVAPRRGYAQRVRLVTVSVSAFLWMMIFLTLVTAAFQPRPFTIFLMIVVIGWALLWRAVWANAERVIAEDRDR